MSIHNALQKFCVQLLGCSSFLDGFKIFGNADSYRGFAPMAGESRIGADFFIFLDLG